MLSRGTSDGRAPVTATFPQRADVRLLGRFRLRAGSGEVALPPAAQRMIAFLALREHPPLRPHVAGQLWPESSEEQALASLRSTLWRLRRLGCPVVEAHAGHVRLVDGVGVDVDGVVARARRILDDSATLADGDDDPSRLGGELLPGWWEDWIVLDRERLRQLRLHALERLAGRLADASRFSPALDAALLAVDCEPLRESAHRAVITVHLAEGNYSEARRVHDAYRELLWRELGVRPSRHMEQLLAARPV